MRMIYWRLTVLFLWQLCPNSAASDFQCLGTKACVCKRNVDDTMTVTCCSKQYKLTSVPLMPLNVSNIKLVSCDIKTIKAGSFHNLPNLNRISITLGQVEEIQANAFVNLTSLFSLDLSRNLYLTKISPSSFVSLGNMKYLKIEGCLALPLSQLPNFINAVPPQYGLQVSFYFNILNQFGDNALRGKDLSGLNTLQVREFLLQDVRINKIEREVYEAFNTTKCLSLAYNEFLWFSKKEKRELFQNVAHLQNMLVIHLSGQGVQTHQDGWKPPEGDIFVHRVCSEAEADSYNLSCPRLTKAQIEHFVKDLNFREYGYVPSSLQRLYMNNIADFAPVLGAPPLIFTDNNVTHISMANAQIIYLYGPIAGFQCLRYLDLSGTKLMIYNPTSLSYFPSLENLNLSRCQIANSMEEQRKYIFRNMSNLKILDLSLNKIKKVWLYGLTVNAPKLSILHLNDNHLNHIPEIYLSNIKLLDLSGNQIKIVDEKQRNIYESLSSLSNRKTVFDLQRNSFVCECHSQSISFIKWFKTTRVQFLNGSQYECKSMAPVGASQLNIKSLNLTQFWFACHFYALVASGSCVFLFFVIGVVGCVVSRYNIVFQYKLYRLRRHFNKWVSRTCGGNSSEMLLQADDSESYDYVYIVFEENDWTKAEQLGSFIEANSDFRPWYHDKQFLPNLPILESIFQSLEKCDRCIAILSQELFSGKSVDWALTTCVDKGPGYVISVGVYPLPLEQVLKHKSSFVRHLLDKAVQSRGDELEEAAMGVVLERLMTQ